MEADALFEQVKVLLEEVDAHAGMALRDLRRVEAKVARVRALTARMAVLLSEGGSGRG